MSGPKRISKDLLSDDLRNEIESKLSGSHIHKESDIIDLDKYPKSEVDYKLSLKLDKTGTFAWEQITGKPQLADNKWKAPVNSPADLPLSGNSDGDIRLTLGEEKYVFTWDSKLNQWLLIGADGVNVDWEHIGGKPLEFRPVYHKHSEADITDLDKYTRAETDALLLDKSNLSHTHSFPDIQNKPTSYPPSSHKHSESDITDLNKYSREEIDVALAKKANTQHTHIVSNVTGLQGVLDGKVDKVNGKGLSTNDFTDLEKDKLNSLSESASVDYETMHNSYTQHVNNADVHVTTTEKSNWNGKVNTTTFNGHVNNSNIHVTQVDKNNWNEKSNFSGNYNDLTNKPDVAMRNHSHDWNEITGKPTLFTPSPHTHDYGELANRPTIPTKVSQLANDLRFVGPASIPMNLSQLINDVGFIKANEVPNPPPAINIGTSTPSNNAETWYKVIG